MHIKQLIIQGFKTYKDRTVIDEFSPQLNIVLGKNGAGKVCTHSDTHAHECSTVILAQMTMFVSA